MVSAAASRSIIGTTGNALATLTFPGRPGHPAQRCRNRRRRRGHTVARPRQDLHVFLPDARPERGHCSVRPGYGFVDGRRQAQSRADRHRHSVARGIDRGNDRHQCARQLGRQHRRTARCCRHHSLPGGDRVDSQPVPAAGESARRRRQRPAIASACAQAGVPLHRVAVRSRRGSVRRWQYWARCSAFCRRRSASRPCWSGSGWPASSVERASHRRCARDSLRCFQACDFTPPVRRSSLVRGGPRFLSQWTPARARRYGAGNDRTGR